MGAYEGENAVKCFGGKESALWNEIAFLGCQEASEALSRMFQHPVLMSAAVKARLPIPEVAQVENPEEAVIGARLVLKGDASGEILFILPTEAWNHWKSRLLGDSPSLELEWSAFSEVANIAGAFFIQNLSDKTSLKMNFSPPEVVRDMFATAFEETLIQMSEEAAEILVVETRLSVSGADIQGYLFFIPSQAAIDKIMQKWEAQ